MITTTKISERQVLKNVRFINKFGERFIADVILDPGCSQFGQLPPRPFKPTVRVMFDFGKQAWVKAEI